MTLLPDRKWTPTPAIGSPEWAAGKRGRSDRAVTSELDPMESTVRDLDLVRTFVSEMVGEVSDRQWAELCAGARGASTVEEAISRVVLRASASPVPATIELPNPKLPAGPPAPAAPEERSRAGIDGTESGGDGRYQEQSQGDNEAVEADERSDVGHVHGLLAVPAGFGVAPAEPTASDATTESATARGVETDGLRPGSMVVSDALAPEVEVVSTAIGDAVAPAVEEVTAESLEAYDLLPIPPGFAAPSTPLVPTPAGVGIVPGTIPVLTPPTRTATKRRRAHARHRATLDSRRFDRRMSIAAWVRNIGAVILLFTAWQLWGTAITQHHSQNQLQSSFDAKVHRAPPTPKAAFSLVAATVALPDPPLGTVVAQLQIPKIGLDQFVVSGTGSNQLSLGPGHYLGTAQPGQAGNVAIAGHRTTHGAPFNRLAELAIGDPLYLTTTTGHRLTYIVSATPTPVSPTNVTVLNNFGDSRLTLTTCNPEFSARQRLIVVAAYLPPGATHPVTMVRSGGHPYKLGDSLTSGWGWSEFPLVLLFGGLLVLLGLFNKRLAGLYGWEGRWLILVPVWIVLLLALFETLVNFLPAAV